MGYILPSMSDINSENATVGDNSSSSDKDEAGHVHNSAVRCAFLPPGDTSPAPSPHSIHGAARNPVP